MKRNLILIGVLAMFSSVVFARDPQPTVKEDAAARTYNWIVPDMKRNQNPMYSSTYSRQRIQKAFDEALNQKGMVRETEHPDLLLQFHTYTQRVRRNYYGSGYPMMGWGRFGWGMPYGGYGYGYGGYPYSSNGTDGTLVLDVVDAKTGDIIWQRAISGDVTNPNHLDKRINKGVKKLMKNFPIGQG